MPSYAHHHSSPLDDTRMDALKCNNNSAPPEETAEDADAAGALVEKDGFSVEDLLDLEEFGEPDKDGAEPEDDDAPPVPAAAEERSKDDSQPLSVVTYDLPSPPPIVRFVLAVPSSGLVPVRWAGGRRGLLRPPPAAAAVEEVQARRQGQQAQAQEARAQAEAPPYQLVRRRRGRVAARAERPPLQPLWRAEDPAVARGARGRKDAVQCVRRPLQVGPAPARVPPGVQPHLREQHPLQLPSQGPRDAPQEGGRHGRHRRAGRGVVLSCTRCQQGRWPPSGGCTFFFLAIMALYRT
ncbi:GATA zinc finger family protein [Zea mays]|uniref:GATA zinc finger family protein n=1 Tax=Zea mays TaxID=4577 RepID=A0A1D6E4G2_MAIZE|nr:GATA zinc finger family protein [Zea mays]